MYQSKDPAPVSNVKLAAALDTLGLSATEFARLVDESDASVRAWAEGSERAPRWIDLLVRTWLAHPGVLAASREQADARLTMAPQPEDDIVFLQSA